MKLAIITPTRNRLYTLGLLHKYISRQTRKPDLWIIATDGKKPDFPDNSVETIISQAEYEGSAIKSFTSNLVRAVDAAEKNGADAIIIMEDDDWYAPEYVQNVESLFNKGHIVGSKPVRWFYISTGEIKTGHYDYCSLAQLGFDKKYFDLFRTVAASCNKANSFNIDEQFFHKIRRKKGKLYTSHLAKHFLGLKGIYNVASGDSRGLTRQHKRFKRTFKGYLRRFSLLNKRKRKSLYTKIYKSLCTQIGVNDAIAYREIIQGATPNQWGEFR